LESDDASKALRRFRVALAGICAYVILDAIVQILPPHYSPVSQAESDLAVGPYGIIMAVNFLNRGLLSAEFIAGFAGYARSVGEDVRRYRIGVILIGVWSIGSFLLAFFPTDVPPADVTWHGALHLLLALAAFFGAGLGAFAVSLRIPGEGVMATLRRYAVPVSGFCLASFLAVVLAPGTAPRFNSQYGGLIERVFIGSVLAWMGGVSLILMRRLSRPRKAREG